MEKIIKYIEENSVPLFKTQEDNSNCAVFDKRGFEFADLALDLYKTIKSQPHLYVAFGSGFTYVGKSFQTNGRWKRSHYYHLGTLAHELLPGSLKSDEQRHNHWIDAWMLRESVDTSKSPHTIQLREQVRIAFIPFEEYSGTPNHLVLSKREIRQINTSKEAELIRFLSNEGEQLLNIQNNR